MFAFISSFHLNTACVCACVRVVWVVLQQRHTPSKNISFRQRRNIVLMIAQLSWTETWSAKAKTQLMMDNTGRLVFRTHANISNGGIAGLSRAVGAYPRHEGCRRALFAFARTESHARSQPCWHGTPPRGPLRVSASTPRSSLRS